jgi:hypothetical protein
MEAGSELGFHRGGFSGMDFDSLMVVDMWRLTVWVRDVKKPRVDKATELCTWYDFRVTRFSRGRCGYNSSFQLRAVYGLR